MPAVRKVARAFLPAVRKKSGTGILAGAGPTGCPEHPWLPAHVNPAGKRGCGCPCPWRPFCPWRPLPLSLASLSLSTRRESARTRDPYRETRLRSLKDSLQLSPQGGTETGRPGTTAPLLAAGDDRATFLCRQEIKLIAGVVSGRLWHRGRREPVGCLRVDTACG